jgi:hypothetical protein
LLNRIAGALSPNVVDPVETLREVLALRDRRPVQRWLNEAGPLEPMPDGSPRDQVPPGIWAALITPLSDRITELTELLDELEERNDR